MTARLDIAAYPTLEARFRRLALLGDALGLLAWDRRVMMPAGGAEARAGEITELGLVRHQMLAEPALADLLGQAEAAAGDLDSWQRANLGHMRRTWRHATAVPADLYEAATRAELACEMAWRRARPANDFAALAPALVEVVRLKRETAAAKGAALGCAPYDALLDEFSPGLRAAQYAPLFDELAAFLPGFIDRVIAAQAREPPVLRPAGPFPIARQRRLARELMARVGFPFDSGRLDESDHPFSGGTPEDLRVTTRYDEADFATALMAVLHETGHALYQRNLPAAWRHQPVGEALGIAVHESQSLLIEMQACRGRAFLAFAAPRMCAAFAGDGPAWSADNIFRLYTRVERGLIRVDADEVTYPAHILLRTRLETALIAGTLRIADLPGAWAEAMVELVGVAPPDDRSGCLQDIHWMDGAFGYFPTYALGGMMAAQLFAAARRAEPAIEPGLAEGDFVPLLAWLGANVHGLGSSIDTNEMLARATGRGLGTQAYVAHLRARYLC